MSDKPKRLQIDDDYWVRVKDVQKAVDSVVKAGHLYGANGGCTTAYSEGQGCNVYDVFDKKFGALGFIKEKR